MVSFHCVCTVGQGCGLSSVSQMLLVSRSRACKVYALPATELLHCSDNPLVVGTEAVKRKSWAQVAPHHPTTKHIKANRVREFFMLPNLGEDRRERKRNRRAGDQLSPPPSRET